MFVRKHAIVAGEAIHQRWSGGVIGAHGLVIFTALIFAAMASTADAQCEPQWFAGRGFPGTNGVVYASAAWDPDGVGGQPPMPVVAGSFNIAGEVFANNIAAWDGEGWIPMGAGIPGTNTQVRSLQVFDDGAGGGPALYAGGFFNTASGAPANYIARWNGTTWTSVGTGMNGRVEALAVFDDGLGGGPKLYAGGAFTLASGHTAKFIAKWNGTNWSAVGTGMDNWVLTLTVFNDGSGPALYAGGQFIVAGGVSAPFAAKWNGSAWSDLDTGEVDGVIHAMTTYDDGNGPDLYAAGEFTFIGTLALGNFIARWDGTSWTGLGAGTNDTIYRLTVFDGGDGPALYTGGIFTSAGIVNANHVAAWDGTDWSALGGGVNNTVTALAVVEDGGEKSSSSLYVGGLFHATEDFGARHIARWDGEAWSHLGSGTGMNAPVYALTTYDDGTPGEGPSLHAGGGFTTAGTTLASNVAKWNATAGEWSPLDGGTNFMCQALATFNEDEANDALFAGGWFTNAGGAPANYIAQWNGAEWSSVDAGTGYIVRAMTVFDDGTKNGPALYAGGAFQTAGGRPANFIARWDGADWLPLESGMNSYVYALAVFDDGSGPALYAGGEFTNAGGDSANYIAQWDGTEWTPLDSGMNSAVYALAVFDDGSGSALYAGGFFNTAGGDTANCIAKWNGKSWSSVGTGMAGGAFPAVLALAVFDDGTGDGPALYAGGQFTTAGGAGANRIAKWSAQTGWSPLSTGLQGTSQPAVHALTVFDDGTSGAGASLYVGGAFDIAGGVVSAYWARWGCPTTPIDIPADLTGDGVVDVDDLLLLINSWNACDAPCPPACIGDLNENCTVDVDDLLILINSWS